MTDAMRRVLAYVASNGTYENAYADLTRTMKCGGQFAILAIDRSLDACVRRGWVKQVENGDYEATFSGIAALGWR